MRNLKKLFMGLCLAAGLAASVLALSPAAEADRLQLHGKEAFNAGDFATTVEDFAKIETMNVKKIPETFSYLYGVSLANLKRYDDAKIKLETYIGLGSNTKFYKEALEAYNRVINAQKADELARQQAQKAEESARQQAAERLAKQKTEALEKYKNEMRKYETAKADWRPSIDRCKKRVEARSKKINDELNGLHRQAEKCGEGWGNALGIANGQGDRCAPLWNQFESAQRKYSNFDSDAESDRCETLYSEPKKPAPPAFD